MISNPVLLAYLSGLFIGGVIVALVMGLTRVRRLYKPTVDPQQNTDIHEFLFEVHMEILRAKEKHPGNEHKIVALMEEVGELAKAHLENEPEYRKRAEAVQVACVAARIATERDGDFL